MMLLMNLCCRHGIISTYRIQSRCVSFDRQVFKPKKKGIGVTGYILGAIPVVTFCLGTWQVQRKKWKEDLIHRLEEKTTLLPVQLPHDLEEIPKLEYQRVLVRGCFDHSKEMYITPRSLVTSKEDKAAGSLFSGSGHVGSWIVTPFHLQDRDYSILVNRGWVPKGKTSQRERSEVLVKDNIDLVGVIRLTEKRVPLASKHLTSDSITWSRRDVERMAQVSGCQPVFIDAVAESSQPGGPIGGQTRATLRNEHLSYIITWYSLSAATAFQWYTKFLKKPVL